MRFTVPELLQAGSTKWDIKNVNAVVIRNLEDLCRKVNALGFAPPCYASSCLRNIESQKNINPNAMGSSHLYGCAVDIADPKGELAVWLRKNQHLLVSYGLWMEDSRYTKGWVHLQTHAPKSFNRFFIP